jgi:hypothetical protein
MYYSIYSYVLYFKNTFLPEKPSTPYKYEEPEIITHQDITDSKYSKPYPSGMSGREGYIISPNIYKETDDTPLSDDQKDLTLSNQKKRHKFITYVPPSYSIAYNEANYDGLP